METGTGQGIRVFRPTADYVRAHAHELADILIDAVDGGASVSYLPPLRPLAAVKWVLDVADAMGRSTHLFLAEDAGRIVGTVQLVRASQQNQPHRAEVVKMLVHRQARRRGVGRALLQDLETTARVLGITLLTLDTAIDGEGLPLYEAMGFRRAGVIPAYSLGAEGQFVDTVIFYKQLA